MDRGHKEFQFLGFFFIFKEALKITASYRKIFSQIPSIILPLSVIILAQIEISEYLFRGLIHNWYALKHTQIGSRRYSKISEILLLKWATFWLFKVIISFLSTSAIVYTTACIYTAKEISYTKAMKVAPKVWKRLMANFIWSFIIAYALCIVLLLGVLWVVTVGPSSIGITVGIVLLIIYLSGFVYISFMWHLAGIISVLEYVYGIQALFKSKKLIKGNTGLCAGIFLLNKLCLFGIHLGYKATVVGGNSRSGKIWYACLWFMLLSMLIHFALVIQTIIYFICKSYHHENIDKSSLSDHLEVYGGDYVRLYYKDVQLEHSEV